MAKVTQSDSFPLIQSPPYNRVDVCVTFSDDDGFAISQQAVIDIAPCQLVAYLLHQGVLTTIRFRLVSSHRFWHLCMSWRAASFGYPLPIALQDIQRVSATEVRIAPPWPLDFELNVVFLSETSCEDSVATFTSLRM